MKQTEDPLVLLARETIENLAHKVPLPKPRALPENLPEKAGCFVSIHTASTDELRGCIGTIGPTLPSLAEEVINNAVSASSEDPRFPPIRADELHDIHINVDVLYPAEPANLEMLDPKNYGVIVSKGYKKGCSCPTRRVDSVEEAVGYSL